MIPVPAAAVRSINSAADVKNNGKRGLMADKRVFDTALLCLHGKCEALSRGKVYDSDERKKVTEWSN